ncbi:hypothetical protein HYC85_012886 [Camellia sinensis]|uniref:PGG domain-containing protein n=1 Tax=Camellia sinensis TaxID=4442 RepID=A0A7J7HD98_CAMSI|nr:hypothetical protein HYC85_012886 [Camellia sinensis]
MEGNINILKLIAEHLNLQLTPNKNTVLHIAALFGQTECAKDILKMNSSLLCKTNVKGDTALHLAVREGQQDSVDALIKYVKKLDAEGSVELESGSIMTKKMLRATIEDGDTALHNVVRLLAEDLEYTYRANNAGETPFYIAAKRRHHQVVSQILKTCIAPAYGGPGGRTALHVTVTSNNEGPDHLASHDNGGSGRWSRWWWRRWYWASVDCCGDGDDVMEVVTTTYKRD